MKGNGDNRFALCSNIMCRGEPTCSPGRIILSYRLWRGKRCCPICGRPMVAPTIRLQFFIGAAKTVRASIDAYFPKQKVDFIINDRANLFYYPLHNRIMQAITPCVPLLPKDNFLFENIGKNPVFMRLFSMFSACFLFETFNDNITARQFIIIVNSGKIHFFSVKRDSNRILLYIILRKYNIIANNLK